MIRNPYRNEAYSFVLGLTSQVARPTFQINPTLEAGDFKISKDGGAFVNLTNLPVVSPSGSAAVLVSLTAAEMDAVTVTIVARDQAGNEWDEVLITVNTIIPSTFSQDVFRNEAYNFVLGLTSQTNRPNFQAAPTIAPGDFKISKDGGAFVNLANLPVVSPVGDIAVSISLTATEMDADIVVLSGKDQAGNEWDEFLASINTVLRTDSIVWYKNALVNTTPGGIKKAVAIWLNRGDTATLEAINIMFKNAHRAIQRRKNFLVMQGTDDITLTANVDVYDIITKIPDFKQPEALYLWNISLAKAERFFIKKSIEEVRYRRITSDPTLNALDMLSVHETFIYAVWAGNIEIWPKLNASSIVNKKLVFDYWKYLAPPTDSGIDFFTEHCHDYLLYRTLFESPGFLGNDVRIKLWQSMMDRFWAEIVGDETGRDVQGDDLVMRG